MQRFLSVITINYNNANGLRQTLESVINQSFTDFEYIVIDGGSNDASVDVIKSFAHKLDYWVTEKDSGIYNAMNKGINKATGKYVLFVNSGDVLISDTTLEEVSQDLSGEEIIYGDYKVIAPEKTWAKRYPDNLTFSHFIHDSLSHSAAAFIKRDAFKCSLAAYDETLKSVSDWKWYLLAIFKHHYSYKHLSKVIGIFDYTGITASNASLAAKEKQEVFETEFKEVYNEISLLLSYKTKYETLESSKMIKGYLKLKSLIFRKN